MVVSIFTIWVALGTSLGPLSASHEHMTSWGEAKWNREPGQIPLVQLPATPQSRGCRRPSAWLLLQRQDL